MRNTDPCVLIIDDDPEFRGSVAELLRSVGLATQQFSCVSDFLKAEQPDGPTCLVLDVRLPGRTGFSTRPWSWRRWRRPADRLH